MEEHCSAAPSPVVGNAPHASLRLGTAWSEEGVSSIAQHCPAVPQNKWKCLWKREHTGLPPATTPFSLLPTPSADWDHAGLWMMQRAGEKECLPAGMPVCCLFQKDF